LPENPRAQERRGPEKDRFAKHGEKCARALFYSRLRPSPT
jgi:hypothetical protein